MISILVAIGLGLLTLAFVLYPLYQRRPSSQQAATTENGAVPPTEGEQAARAALHEVELDYQLGNIADTDYDTLRQRYMRRALTALKSRHEREEELDDVIEAKLRKLKEGDEDVRE
jgi:hypothetical protein